MQNALLVINFQKLECKYCTYNCFRWTGFFVSCMLIGFRLCFQLCKFCLCFHASVMVGGKKLLFEIIFYGCICYVVRFLGFLLCDAYVHSMFLLWQRVLMSVTCQYCV